MYATGDVMMKDALLGYGPQGLALKVNPWQSKRSLEAALLYRGTIVSAWANIETTINEIAIRVSITHPYQGLRNTYPFKLKSRTNFLRHALEIDGPITPFSGIANKILDRFESQASLRNLMAHGSMQVLPGWGATLKMFSPQNGNEIRYQYERFTEERMRRLAMRAARLSRFAIRLKAQLDQANLLEPLTGAE